MSSFDLVLIELRERPDMMYSRRISELVFATATPLAGSIISLQDLFTPLFPQWSIVRG
nr:hypothetical protein [Halostella salina]